MKEPGAAELAKAASDLATEIDERAQSKATGRVLREKALEASWKDEAWTVTLILPIVMSFMPYANEYARVGFAILNTAPIWFVGLALMGVAFAFHRKVVSLWGLIRGGSTTANPSEHTALK